MPPSIPTTERAKQLSMRHETLQQFWRLKTQMSVGAAARAVGVGKFTLYRWTRLYNRFGVAGLESHKGNCGRKPLTAGIKLSVHQLRRVEALILEHGSAISAWRQFAKAPDCPPAVRALVKRPHLPESLARLVQLKPLPAKVWQSKDGRRVYFAVEQKQKGTR